MQTTLYRLDFAGLLTMKSLTGQYECVHHSGVGLEYFTSRIDHLTLYANGRCLLVVQERSRLTHAAKSLLSGQQVNTNAPEIRREGTYRAQGNQLKFSFDDGTQEQGQVLANGIQIGSDIFEKVSDSTFLPPPQRMKSNMEDIAKGLKIAGAIGGAAIKAVKTLQDTIQTAQGSQQSTTGSSANPSSAGTPQQTYQPPQPTPTPTYNPPSPTPTYTAPASSTAAAQESETFFCDQCGQPVRPGKRFCNHCGARLP
jgi:cell division protein FtsN